ncbi:formate dehydrogenase gamma subunit [Paraburkholderia hospita]|uniref:Formate dehydrogenase gamma subunit n=1 Tax=Paraburkholderia hospita TaxID=169430 RepID=A0ABN0FNU9_9BURK|nr:formate dehydrogenase subunit gamma [Paraburkholderia hospita]EIN00472.1 formate dehydrogenase gamma subunit [Paraburkholderia hospita]OUL68187.1 formate dehydrogenase subunit gamma [Paraburkholderia hospita]
MEKKNLILRTKFAERLGHWFLVICFVPVALSGLSWFFPSLSWLGGILGTPQLARVLHPFLGVMVFALLVFMFSRFAHHNVLVNTDRLWFKNVKSVLLNRHDKPLRIGKYNAGQKVLFWAIMACAIALLASGLVIWRRYFAEYFPIPVIRLALLLHALAGIGLILLIVGHIYLAIWVRGSISGMLTGYVSRAWIKQHHDRWHDEVIADENSTRGRP